VGPVYRDGRHGEPELLASCYRERLRLDTEHAPRAVPFPAISCGVFGYPHQAAADIAVNTVLDVVVAHPGAYDLVRFVLWGQDTLKTFSDALQEAAQRRGLEIHA